MRILLAIYLLGFVATCKLPRKCPSKREIRPCACKRNRITNRGIIVSCKDTTTTWESLSYALVSVFDKNYVRLELSGLNLEYFGANFFDSLKLEELIIKNCSINDLAVGRPVFRHLEQSLKMLEISDSISILRSLNIGDLYKLESLVLHDAILHELFLENDWLPNVPPSLKTIALTGNGAMIFGDRVFENITNLYDLRITSFNFGSIRRSLLPNPAEKLTYLSITNQILTHPSDIPEDFFSNMPALEHLDMSNNRLKRLQQNIWEPIWAQLKTIDLSGNPLECSHNMTWMLRYKRKTSKEIYGSCKYRAEQHKDPIQLSNLFKGRG